MREGEIKFDNTRDKETLIKEKQRVSRKSLGGAMAEYSLWASTEETGKRRGVTDPEGNFLPLEENEYFSIEKNFDTGTFEAVVKNKEGNILKIIGKGNLPIREQEAAIRQRDEEEIAKVRENSGIGGDRENRDRKYADMFWEDNKNIKEKMRRTMMEIIENSINHETGEGTLYLQAVSRTGIKEKDKARLSAYRILAREMGYEIGEFVFDKKTDVVRASIKKLK